MLVLVRDINGNTLIKTEMDEVEASRLEGFDIRLSDNAETLIVTVALEES